MGRVPSLKNKTFLNLISKLQVFDESRVAFTNQTFRSKSNSKIDEKKDTTEYEKEKEKRSSLNFENLIFEKIEKVNLYSPYFLFQNLVATICSEEEFSPFLFRNKYFSIFWNCIWYFQIVNLPVSVLFLDLNLSNYFMDYFSIEEIKDKKKSLNFGYDSFDDKSEEEVGVNKPN